MSSNGKSAEIDAIAAEWIVRADRAPLTEDERRERDAWLADDPRHLGAHARALAAWTDLDRLSALAGGARPAQAAPPRARWAASLPALAAAVGLIVVSGVAVAYGVDRFAGREQTRIGEVRRIALQDGSVATLNTGSVINVRYGPRARTIRLREGEASFEVAHDDARPFVVDTGGVSVAAVGTAFAVRRTPAGDIAVTVSEGAVRVARARDALSAQIVPADHHLIAQAGDAALKVQPLAAAEVSRRLAWQEGRLIFDGESLGAAASEMNRYSDVKIVIDDSALADAAFVGVFRIGDAKTFAETVAAAFDARVTEDGKTLRIGKS